MRWYITFMDDYSWETHTFLMQNKAQVLDKYKAYEAWVSTQYGRKVKILQSDNGGEYINTNLKAHLQRNGTECHFTVHDSLHKNGVAERLNQTLTKYACIMLFAANLPGSLWGEAIAHTTWLKNQTSTCELMNKTPFEAVNNKKPNLANI
jgi:hypothetical protein